MRRFENLEIWKYSEARGISRDASFINIASLRVINNFQYPIVVRQPSPFVKGAGGLNKNGNILNLEKERKI